MAAPRDENTRSSPLSEPKQGSKRLQNKNCIAEISEAFSYEMNAKQVDRRMDCKRNTEKGLRPVNPEAAFTAYTTKRGLSICNAFSPLALL